MEQYHNQIQQILEHGERRDDRTGTGTVSLFGMQA
ncbi:MAG: thymidylate synthase, partial [Candidatus Obscuribacterales bacterium]|nr:thymidylate synthase [Candidatus Obscuribacterales bacterium]